MRKLILFVVLLIVAGFIVGCGASVSDKYESDRGDQKSKANDMIDKESSGE